MLLSPLLFLTYKQVFPAMMIGFASNNILPAHLGEFVRMQLLSKQFVLSKVAIITTIVIERLFDLLSILFLFSFSLLFVVKEYDFFDAGTVFYVGMFYCFDYDFGIFYIIQQFFY